MVAAADPPVQWEYALVDANNPACVQVETTGAPAIPASPSPRGVERERSPCVGGTFAHPTAVLDYFGDQGWELVSVDGLRFRMRRER